MGGLDSGIGCLGFRAPSQEGLLRDYTGNLFWG